MTWRRRSGLPLTEDDISQSFAAFVAGVHERGPTTRDFQRVLGLSSTSVSNYRLRALVKAGLIEHVQRGQYGYYRLTAKGEALRGDTPVAAFALPESGGGW